MVGERVSDQMNNYRRGLWWRWGEVEEYHHHFLQIKFVRSKCHGVRQQEHWLCLFLVFFFSELTESHNFSARAHIFVLHRWRWMMHTVISTDMLVKMYLKLVLGCISWIKYAPIFLLFLYPFVLATCYWDACTLYFWNSMVFQ